jgi:hypothetical protein
MSEGNNYGVPEEILRQLRKMSEFRPCVFVKTELDELTILQEDCSFTEEQIPGGYMSVLRKNHGGDDGKIVGVILHGWSRWTKEL